MDVDFSDRIASSQPPPRVIHLRFGNMRRNDFSRISGETLAKDIRIPASE